MQGLSYQMTINEVSKNNRGYVVKAEVEDGTGWNHHKISFVVDKAHVQRFPIGETINIHVEFGSALLVQR
jgi:hypothetical protein